MKRWMMVAVVIGCAFASCGAARAQTAGELYRSARTAAAAGDRHMAYMYYAGIVRDVGRSSVRQQALFAVGEYQFLVGATRDAVTTLVAFTEEYPNSPAAIFALGYLYRIAVQAQDAELTKNLKEKIVTYYRLCFLFKKCKETRYRSGLLIRHKVAYYIDKVEFFSNGELVAQIPY